MIWVLKLMNFTNKVIKLQCHQTLVNYRKPSSFIIKETYPLPPFSTVIGLIHNVCGYKEYHDMKISIQGLSKSNTFDLQTLYNFSNSTYEEGRHQLKVITNKSVLGVNRGPQLINLISEIDLTVHVKPNDDDFEFIFNSLKYPKIYPSLGRYEDLLNIKSVEIVNVEEKLNVISNNDIYVPIELIKLTQYTTLNLNKKYEINGKFRKWVEQIKVTILSKGQRLEKGLCDENGDLVILL